MRLSREYAARRRAFDQEASRAVADINAAAADPTSDEAAVLQELDLILDSAALGDEWKA